MHGISMKAKVSVNKSDESSFFSNLESSFSHGNPQIASERNADQVKSVLSQVHGVGAIATVEQGFSSN